MLTLITGQKAKFTDINIAQQFTLVVELTANNTVMDVACFGLTAQQKLADDDYMTFYNQPSTPCHAVRWQANQQQQLFNIDLTKLPTSIDYLVITATIDGQATMRKLGASSVTLEQAGKALVSYPFDGSAFNDERAIMLLQVYRKNAIWRINAVGQGFNGGLSALVSHFGGEVADDEPPKPINNERLQNQCTNKATTDAMTSPDAKSTTPNLKKVILDKPGSAHRISLTKGANDPLLVEAIWVDNGDASADNDDLDLRVGILAYNSKDMSYIHYGINSKKISR